MIRLFTRPLLCIGFFLAFLNPHSLEASHAMGANVTYSCIGPNSYRVTLQFFRDCDGISPLSSYTLNYRSVACGVNSTITLSQVGPAVDITPLCPSQSSGCGGGSFPYGIEQYTFQGILNLPAGCGNDWVLSWSECCRNSAITTLNNPGNQDMYVSANLNNTITPCNNSPVFNNPPTSIVCVNQLVNYNHGVTDPDGDVLVFSLANCQQSSGTNVNYGGGYSGANPLTTLSGVTINPATGALTFTPTIIQIGVICVRVQEYRGGVLIGEVNRDMQFNVINCTNQAPTASGVNGTPSYTITTCVGSQVCFGINTADANGNNITMTWNAGIPGGFLNFTGNGGPSPTGQFCWTPTAADIGTNFFTVTVEDNACPITGVNTYTYTVNVNTTVNTINAGTDVAICPGGSTNLLATSSGATSYTWTPAAGLSCTNCANPVATPGTTTIYTVTGTFPDGCTLSDAVLVTVNPLPTVAVTPAVAYSCPGSPVTLTASGTGITGYLWSTGAITSAITVTPAATTTYNVTVTSAAGCQASTSVTVNVNTPSPTVCNVIYASPAGTGTGTRLNPASLANAITMAACNNTVIKLAIGTYTLNNAITIPGYLTLEGGFDPALSWQKTSTAAATTITRSALNPEGVANQERIVAFYLNGASNFRFQDLTISTAPATNSGMSTYCVHLTNCSNYSFVRVQLLPGNAAAGSNGLTGVTGLNGSNGSVGLAGAIDSQDNPGHGGNGGAGGGPGAGVAGVGGVDAPGCCVAGIAGTNGTASTNARAGGGGGGGGCGGEEDNNGGVGGNGGGVNGGAAQLSGGGGGAWGNPGGGGGNGTAGTGGAPGTTGAAGAAGSHVAGFWVPGALAGTGTDGAGGRGGCGGGGGGGQYCFFCIDGAGDGGGGGGGGGQGGSGGTGGRGGGSSFGAYLYNNGANGIFDDCRVVAGTAGAGGIGGNGGNGGTGGTGGNGSTYGIAEIGRGGNGGAGGAGGAGGSGGDGSAGVSSQVYTNGGTPLVVSDINFGLNVQPTITMSNNSCTNTDVTYTAAVSALWNLGANATNATPTGTSVITQYTATGRKDIVYNANVYTGFSNIIMVAGSLPSIGTNAPLVSGNYRVCAGSAVSFYSLNPGVNYIYDWNLGGGAVPNTYSGTGFQNLNNIVFNTPGTFVITLIYTTDCCGASSPGTLTLIVDPVPATVGAGAGTLCFGSTTPLTLTASGASSYTWSPAIGLSGTTGSPVYASPSSTTTYTVTGANATGTCFSSSNVTVTVSNIALTPNPVTASCANNGSAGVTVGGGSGSYTYNWSPLPQITNPVTNLISGTYFVVVTDAVTGCRDSTAVVVPSGPGLITVNPVASTPVNCFGGTNGSATFSVSGGSGGPYSYNWSGGGGAGIVPVSGGTGTTVPLGAGTYTVTVIDMGNPGCPSGTAITIVQPGDLVLALIDTTSTTCLNSADGDATVNAGGGNGPFNYVWNTIPVQNGPVATGLLPGTYTVTVTDQNGCTEVLPVTIVNISGCILAVEYLGFTATPAEDHIQLLWITATETDNQGWEVQRSLNGHSFETLGFQPATAANGSGASYEWPDAEVLPGVVYYYRLRQIDVNGNHSYSEVKQAMIEGSSPLLVTNLWPQPTEGIVNVDLVLAKGGVVKLSLWNMLGQPIGPEISMQAEPGANSLQLDLSQRAAGTYYGKITLDGMPAAEVKIVKIR